MQICVSSQRQFTSFAMNGDFNPQQIYAAHFCAAFFNYPLTKGLKYVIIYSVKSVEENKVALSCLLSEIFRLVRGKTAVIVNYISELIF